MKVIHGLWILGKNKKNQSVFVFGKWKYSPSKYVCGISKIDFLSTVVPLLCAGDPTLSQASGCLLHSRSPSLPSPLSYLEPHLLPETVLFPVQTAVISSPPILSNDIQLGAPMACLRTKHRHPAWVNAPVLFAPLCRGESVVCFTYFRKQALREDLA